MELKYELLREDAETLAVPTCQAARVPRIVCQLAHSMPSILTRTVEYLEVQDLLWLTTIGMVRLIHLSLRFLLMLKRCAQ